MPNRFAERHAPVLLVGLVCLWVPTVATSGPPPQQERPAVPREELFRRADREALLGAAREIIAGDPTAALVTVDAEGRPRVRSVTTSGLGDDGSIWIATRPTTRKVRQIEGNPSVALYFADDDGHAYVSVMGEAILHRDVATFEARSPIRGEWLHQLWPDYPEDFLLIEVRPAWLEVLGHGIEASVDAWRPQAVVFR